MKRNRIPFSQGYRSEHHNLSDFSNKLRFLPTSNKPRNLNNYIFQVFVDNLLSGCPFSSGHCIYFFELRLLITFLVSQTFISCILHWQLCQASNSYAQHSSEPCGINSTFSQLQVDISKM
jgi:hypothetical protein